MSDSIISNERECFICHSTYGLERHHIFHGMANNKKGSLRQKSEHYGLWVYLCYYHHNQFGGKHGVHNTDKADMKLQRVAQIEFEKTHTRKEWMELFHQNFI